MALDEALLSSSSSRSDRDTIIGLEVDDRDSDRMIIDESYKGSVDEVKKEKQTDDNKQPKATNDLKGTRSARRKKAKDKKKTNKEDELACPMKIIDSILAKTSYQKADLSRIVEEKFYEDNDYKSKLASALKNVRYQPTVNDLGDRFNAETTVRPLGWQGTVNLEPSAFLSMNCIHEKPPKRERNRGKAGKKKKPNNNQQKQNNNSNSKAKTDSNSTDSNPETRTSLPFRQMPMLLSDRSSVI